MHRFVLTALVLATATGCSAPGTFTHSGTLHSETRGVILESDSTAQAGMGGATCEVTISNGEIGDDVSVAWGDDQVSDFDGELVLVMDEEGLYTYEPGAWSGDLVDTGGYVDAAFVDTGVVGVTERLGGLEVNWSGDVNASTQVPGSSVSDMATDAATGTVFVATDEGVIAANTDGATAIGQGDLAVWDSAAEVLYTATTGGSELVALESAGATRFTVELDGSVTALTALGTSGQAMVMIERANGGELVTIDGWTGEVLSTMSTPGITDELASSDSGDTVAIVKRWNTYFLTR